MSYMNHSPSKLTYPSNVDRVSFGSQATWGQLAYILRLIGANCEAVRLRLVDEGSVDGHWAFCMSWVLGSGVFPLTPGLG